MVMSDANEETHNMMAALAPHPDEGRVGNIITSLLESMAKDKDWGFMDFETEHWRKEFGNRVILQCVSDLEFEPMLMARFLLHAMEQMHVHGASTKTPGALLREDTFTGLMKNMKTTDEE